MWRFLCLVRVEILIHFSSRWMLLHWKRIVFGWISSLFPIPFLYHFGVMSIHSSHLQCILSQSIFPAPIHRILANQNSIEGLTFHKPFKQSKCVRIRTIFVFFFTFHFSFSFIRAKQKTACRVICVNDSVQSVIRRFATLRKMLKQIEKKNSDTQSKWMFSC